ncbi:hypothetical protein [Thalassolituus hydrocarboniclasticus]|uniref:Uncharacterized protein n=1 Tax=Thalassolituus hydrocarboniclasticus TaxID=2742796 RepID=A0ABY6AGI1_9GAMM|nr:hypothetical protein [Thalassolituus hydrocarboniclasticus]UXD89231.1 hypothetical protein HUF19_18115 [Thalassolituus hydrocarboniclasticus]
MAKLWQQTGYSLLRRGRYSESGRIYLVTAVAFIARKMFCLPHAISSPILCVPGW